MAGMWLEVKMDKALLDKGLTNALASPVFENV
jgi:hypothetical protein